MHLQALVIYNEERVRTRLLAAIVLVVAGVLAFYKLGEPAIFIWDEAIYANNALDMYGSGNPVVLLRNGEFTLYNTKPPFVIWVQALSIAVFGPNELAIRLPSAIAAMLTCLILFLFTNRTLGDYRPAIVAVPVLMTSLGFMKPHVARSGDLDGMLVLWVVFYSCVFIHFLLHDNIKLKKAMLWSGAGLILAFYSKSSAALLPLPGLFLCAVYKRRLLEIVLSKWTYVTAALVVFLCLGYYIIRELVLPGYVDHMTYSDYSRFYRNVMPWHDYSFTYYLENFVVERYFVPYVWIFPVAAILGLYSSRTRALTILLLIWIVAFLLVISSAASRLPWYEAPVYPFLSLVIGIGAVVMLDKVESVAYGSGKWILAAILIALLIPAVNVVEIHEKNVMPRDNLEREGYSMRQLKSLHPEIKDYTLFMPVQTRAHWTQADFYRNAYNRHFGFSITLKDSIDQLGATEKVLCCQYDQILLINERFQTDTLFQNEIGCVLMNTR